MLKNTIIRVSLICLLLLLIESSFAQSQPDDSLLTHIQLNVGNLWDYSGWYNFIGSLFYPSWTLVTASKDSVHLNGKKYTVLERIHYDMSWQQHPGALGQIGKETILQRVDSTNLNVYELIPGQGSALEDELLVDSLRAKEGDLIATGPKGERVFRLYNITTKEFLGVKRTIRHFYLENALISFDFETAEGLGEIYWISGGEGSPSASTLQATIIKGDTIGTLLRNQPPGLITSQEELLFSPSEQKQRLFFINHKSGLIIIDSVSIENYTKFYSKPYYHGWGFSQSFFSKGPFLVFPKDSIYLDIFIRESALEQAFEDTFRIHARNVIGERIPRIDLPVKFDPLVSVRDPSNDDEKLPDTFDLRAYPNPVNSEQSLNILYQINKSQDVIIEVYDILGRHITTLVNKRMEPGGHQTILNSIGFPSGVYFVTLATKNQRETIRVQVIK